MADSAKPMAHTMHCTEVWGGNATVDRSVVMTGLDVWVLSRPYEGDEQGGDIHYLSSCATGRITRLLVADVSGHGSVVAGTALRLRTLMRRYINYVNQSLLVEGLNREFTGLAREGHFATAVVATFWGPSREIEVTNAGHPTPLIYRARKAAWEPFHDQAALDTLEGPSDIPLGILDMTSYARARTRLEPGDLVLFYTDALIEARGSNDKMLGVDGILAHLQQIGGNNPETIVPRLLEAIGAGPAGAPLPDDTTAMLLRLNDRTTTSSLMDGLRATVRVGADFARALLPGGGPIPWPELRLDNLGGVWSERFYRRP